MHIMEESAFSEELKKFACISAASQKLLGSKILSLRPFLNFYSSLTQKHGEV